MRNVKVTPCFAGAVAVAAAIGLAWLTTPATGAAAVGAQRGSALHSYRVALQRQAHHLVLGARSVVAHNDSAQPEWLTAKDLSFVPPHVIQGDLERLRGQWHHAYKLLKKLPAYQRYRALRKRRWELVDMLGQPPGSPPWSRRVHSLLPEVPSDPDLVSQLRHARSTPETMRLEEAILRDRERRAYQRAWPAVRRELLETNAELKRLRQKLSTLPGWGAERRAHRLYMRAYQVGDGARRDTAVGIGARHFDPPREPFTYAVGRGESSELPGKTQRWAETLGADTFYQVRPFLAGMTSDKVVSQVAYRIEWADHVHVRLDGLDIEALLKQSLPRARVNGLQDYVAEELSYLKNHYDRLSDRVTFWRNGRKVEPPF